MRADILQREQTGVNDGLPKALAHQIALMPVLMSACDIIRIAMDNKSDLEITARTYFEAGHHFHLDWMRQQARFMSSDSPWHAEATAGLVDQLYNSQASLTAHMLKESSGGKKQGIADEWFDKHSAQLAQVEPLIAQLQSAGTIDLPMLVIAEQRLRNIYNV
jgi:glutamate dehydrogenase